ncbi:hypothetical protein D3C81_2073960 [compost metagenome]
MLHGIHAEGIYTHVDILVVAVDQILIHYRVLGIEIHTVTGNLPGLYRIGFPGEAFLSVVDVIIGLCRLHKG